MNKKIKIIIAEDQKILREGYKSIISEGKEISVIGEAENGKVLLELLKSKTPDVIILDIEMPVMDGIEALKKISEEFPSIKVLIVSTHVSDILIAHCVKFGAHGYMSKDIIGTDLIDAIKSVYTDGFSFNSTVSKLFLGDILRGRSPSFSLKEIKLSPIEKKIMNLICTEKRSKEIATELDISENTIEFHRKNIFKKTNSKTIAGVVKYAIFHGLGDI